MEPEAIEAVDCPFDDILPRTPYLVIPKMALQAMPIEWRQRFAALLDEAESVGLETPSYHVFRQGADYVTLERDDPEDDHSRIETLHVYRPDPWADYRHATLSDVQALSPRFMKETG